MKIVVATYPKTGTKSLNAALTLLGYNVYDFLEHFYFHEKQWLQIFETGGSPDIFKKMYQDVDVVVDTPAFYFWDDIHQAFPDSKIIVCIRDEDSWMKSFKSEIASMDSSILFRIGGYLSPSVRRFGNFLRWGMQVVVFGISPSNGLKIINERVMRKKFREHNLYVLQNAPKDKLLVFNIKEGWKPLCDFLGLDVPDVPFPHKNIGGGVVALSMKENVIMKRMINEMMISSTIVFALTLVGGYFAYKKCPFQFHFKRLFPSFRLS